MVVRCGENQQPAYPFLIDRMFDVCALWWRHDEQLSFLRFLGFWLGDGNLEVSSGRVCISQRKLQATAWLIDLLDEVFPRWWYRHPSETDAKGITFNYFIQCPPLYEWLRVMAVGPAGYNPLKPKQLRKYPHFDRDEAVVKAEAASKYNPRRRAFGQPIGSKWTERKMMAALSNQSSSSSSSSSSSPSFSPLRRPCYICGDATGERLSCSGTHCHRVDAITRAHPTCVGRTAETAFALKVPGKTGSVPRPWFCQHSECQEEEAQWTAARNSTDEEDEEEEDPDQEDAPFTSTSTPSTHSLSGRRRPCPDSEDEDEDEVVLPEQQTTRSGRVSTAPSRLGTEEKEGECEYGQHLPRSVKQCRLCGDELGERGQAKSAMRRLETQETSTATEEDGDARCFACEELEWEEGDEMLICDGCECGGPLSCLDLDAVPDGDWFCAACRPAHTVPPSPTVTARRSSASSIQSVSKRRRSSASRPVDVWMCYTCERPEVDCDCFETDGGQPVAAAGAAPVVQQVAAVQQVAVVQQVAAAAPIVATGIVWNGGVWDIDADGHWFYRKRWLGPNVASTFANLSESQAVALLEGFNMANGKGAQVRFKKDGKPTGSWECFNSSMPLIDHLQLIGQLAGARVDLRRLYQAGKKTKIGGRTVTHKVDHWMVYLRFTKPYKAERVVVAKAVKPLEIAADSEAAGYYEYDPKEDPYVYDITVQDNGNFLTQRLSKKRTKSSRSAKTAGEGIRAQPVYVGNCVVSSNDGSIEMRDEANKGLIPFALKEARLIDSRGRERAERERERLDKAEVEVKSDSSAAPMDVEEKKEPDAEDVESKEQQAPSNSGAIYSRMDPTVAANVPYPSFPAFMALVSNQLNLTPAVGATSRAPLQLDSSVFIHLMAFIAACLEDSAKQAKLTSSAYAASLASSSPSSLLSYQLLLELAFLSPLSDVQSSASVHLVALVSSLPSFFAPLYLERVDWLKKYLLGNSAESRANTATLLTLLAPSFPASTVATLLPQFNAILASSPSVSSSASDAVHGSTLGIGVLIAEARRRAGEVSKDEVDGVQLLVERLSSGAVAKDASLGAAACVSIGRIGKVARLPLPVEDDQRGEEKEEVQASQEKKQKGEVAPYGRSVVLRRLLQLTSGSERKQERITEEAVKALGCLVEGDPSPDLIRPILDGLLKLVTLKHEEVHFAVGETLAVIGDVECDPSTTAASSPQAAASALSSLPYLEKILSFSVEQLSKGSQVARAASCTWLLCVIKFSQRLPASSYPSLQSRLTIALTDSNQFTQEAAAKALALLYEKTDSPALKEELVAALMRTFTSGAHKLSADTEVVLDSEKGEVSTMKELLTVANDMGQPDLVYRFMDIASHHAAWQSRMGSAFTLQSILGSSAAMKEKVAELLPKLYLYQFDPNPKIKESMRSLWQSLVDHPKQMIDQHFHAIIAHLLRSQDSRQFRVRLAACLGLVDLIPHRAWGEVGPYIAQLWANLFRLLDDVNGETRKAATTLANGLSQLSVRLSDPRYTTHKAEVQAAIDALLPILLKDGLTARPKEVQSISIKTLLSLIKHGGVFLRPHVAELLGTLLEGMSSMESSAFAYLQFHARSLQMSDEDLELARLSVAKNTPLADAVASCLQVVDVASLPSVVSRLTEVLQQGIGLPTLTATGKCIISLVNSPVGGDMREHVGPLMSALVQGLNDQSTSVRRVFAAALGYLCRVAKRKRVGRVIEGLLAQYTSDDSASAKRLSCGLAVQQLVEKASDSTREEFFPSIAPYAFLASHDPEEEVKKLWSAVWEEMVPSTDSGAVTYQTEIVALCRATFDSSSWTMRQGTYSALTTLVKASKARFEEHLPTFVPLVVKAMPGRIWAGKEKLFGLAVALCVEVRNDAGSKLKEEDVKQILQAVLEETRRNKTDHKREAIAAAGEIAQANEAVDVTEEMKPTLDAIFQQATSLQGGASMREQVAMSRAIGSDADVHERKKAAKDDQLYFAVAYTALGRIFPASSFLSSQQLHISWYLHSLTRALRSGLDWPVRVEALKSMTTVLSRAAPGVLNHDLVVDVVDALIASSRDGKQSGVRTKAMDAVLAILKRGDAVEVKALLQPDLTTKLREMLRERRDDPVAEVLTLNDSIRARLDALAAAAGSR